MRIGVLQNWWMIMEYKPICEARFLRRPNRFVADVLLDGREERVHVKNTGRCGELLVPDAKVYLQDFGGHMGSRKLRYSLIAVEKQRQRDSLLVNMDSQAPNQVVKEALTEGRLSLPDMGTLCKIRPEATCGDSRLDFHLRDETGREAYMEVKGVTLEQDGFASFPDAPTLRGIKHLRELAELAKKGMGAYVLFVVQMEGMTAFGPNEERHPAFAQALREAAKAGVCVLAYDCQVTADTLTLSQPVPVRL